MTQGCRGVSILGALTTATRVRGKWRPIDVAQIVVPL